MAATSGKRSPALTGRYTPIQTKKLNDFDPQAWLDDVIAGIADYRASRLEDLLTWNRTLRQNALAA
ncbi:transposase domain-containing protein (plasmid) [Pseudanabaena biceps]|nr:transposase domain-containing protein [Pseudanabaena biceps]